MATPTNTDMSRHIHIHAHLVAVRSLLRAATEEMKEARRHMPVSDAVEVADIAAVRIDNAVDAVSVALQVEERACEVISKHYAHHVNNQRTR